MRFGRSFVWLGLFGVTLAWVLRHSAYPLRLAKSAEARSREDEPLPNHPEAPRGFKTVAAAGGLSFVALAAGLSWYAIDRRAEERATALALTRGVPDHAPALMTRYGCSGCHSIPGAPGADGKVGPDLGGLRDRVYIGGVLRNTPDHLVQWVVDPQRFSPRSAMPVTGITEAEARDVAAYLYTH